MERRFNYYCTNPDGEVKFQKQCFENKTFEDEQLCPVCQEPMKCIGENPHGGYASFASKSDDEKRAILSKRASDHTNTKLKDRVHHIKKQFKLKADD